MNSIQCWKFTRIRIRISFGLKISSEYEYEYHSSVSTIQILFKYYSNIKLFAHLWREGTLEAVSKPSFVRMKIRVAPDYC